MSSPPADEMTTLRHVALICDGSAREGRACFSGCLSEYANRQHRFGRRGHAEEPA